MKIHPCQFVLDPDTNLTERAFTETKKIDDDDDEEFDDGEDEKKQDIFKTILGDDENKKEPELIKTDA